MRRASLLFFTVMFLSAVALAQEKSQPQAEKPVFVPPSARLAAARTAFVRNTGGSDIPYNVVISALEGWGRFVLVDEPAQADIVIEISSPEEERHSSVSGDMTGRMRQSDSRRDLSDDIKLAVFDGRTHLALWSASEKAKGALHRKSREDHLVEATGRLVRKFRQRLEPPPAKSN
jgi:hypothetical protein